MADSPVSPGPSPHRRHRRWWKVPLALVALVILLVAVLPTFISWGLGRGMILSTIEGSINGKVGLSGLSVGWFSPLNVQGFTVTDAEGTQAVNLNVNVSQGLLKLVTNRGGGRARRLRPRARPRARGGAEPRGLDRRGPRTVGRRALPDGSPAP
jgi:hypothetical protein